MGASSSIDILSYNGKIYKHLESCKCIFSCSYKDNIAYKIEYPYWCFECYQYIKNNNFDVYENKLKLLLNEINNKNIFILIEKYGWISERNAIEYAKKNKIDINEFIQNKDLIEKIKLKKLKL
jgi:hypothetical protein